MGLHREVDAHLTLQLRWRKQTVPKYCFYALDAASAAASTCLLQASMLRKRRSAARISAFCKSLNAQSTILYQRHSTTLIDSTTLNAFWIARSPFEILDCVSQRCPQSLHFFHPADAFPPVYVLKPLQLVQRNPFVCVLAFSLETLGVGGVDATNESVFDEAVGDCPGKRPEG